MRPTIDVILPGLFQLPLAELDDDLLIRQLPSLNQILRYGQRQLTQLRDFESLIADSLEYDDPGNLPFACAFDGENSSSTSLLCQAAHLKPDMHHAYVIPLDGTPQTKEDIIIIINDLKGLFKVDYDLEKLDNEHWLMTLKQCEVPTHYPHLLSVLGRKLDPYIKQSREILPWYQLVNEMQMFMHGHAVNQRRLADGLLSINSLWCWGAGDLIRPENQSIHCFCDDALVTAYCRHVGLKVEALDAVKDSMLFGKAVYIDLSLLQALKIMGGKDLSSMLMDLEMNLFLPLVKSENKGALDLRLRGGHEFDFCFSRFSNFRVWRQVVSLKDFLV